MADVITRIPVVAGLAFERASRQPPCFEATLVAEPGKRYFPQAIAVRSPAGEKLGYVAPELALHYFEPISASTTAVTCPARRGTLSDRQTSGVELLLDFSSLRL